MLGGNQRKSWIPGVVSLFATTTVFMGETSDTLAAWRHLAIDNAPARYPTGEDSTRAFLAMTNSPGTDLEEAAAQLATAQASRQRQTGGIFVSQCAVARLKCSHGNAHDAAGRFVCLDIFCYCVAFLDVRRSMGIPSVYIHQGLWPHRARYHAFVPCLSRQARSCA
jgi:hypothetical protein